MCAEEMGQIEIRDRNRGIEIRDTENKRGKKGGNQTEGLEETQRTPSAAYRPQQLVLFQLCTLSLDHTLKFCHFGIQERRLSMVTSSENVEKYPPPMLFEGKPAICCGISHEFCPSMLLSLLV